MVLSLIRDIGQSPKQKEIALGPPFYSTSVDSLTIFVAYNITFRSIKSLLVIGVKRNLSIKESCLRCNDQAPSDISGY